MTRRDFLQHSAAATLLSTRLHAAQTRSLNSRRWTAAVIGHTGRGNFGHSLDLIFNGRSEIDILAVADPDANGRAAAQQRTGAARAYADYREMLERERPDLVSVAPRWTDQRHAMVTAALAAGAHVYCEKPFTCTLAEADDILLQARRTGRKIAVAHQGRLAPATLQLKQLLDDGGLGELVEIRVHGKQDRRAGGEDMVVLGTHQFDLVRFFAGDAQWCSARVSHRGRDITIADVRAATEDIGPIAGDEIQAMFAMPGGMNVHYSSRAKLAASAGPWGMEFVGTKGRARLLNEVHTDAFLLQGGAGTARGATQRWVPLEYDISRVAGGFVSANERVVSDWLAAIAEDRDPVCSGFSAMKSLEMIHAVFAAGLARGRVQLPLASRAHPLSAA